MLKGLAFGPITQVMSYSRYVVNGRRFCTRASEKTTQDSGVYLEAETSVNGTEEIKKFDEDAYMSYAPLDVYKLDDCVGDEDEGYVRANCEAILVYN
ncbi:hypothetical protein ACFX1R_029031 [Malus domestica]